MTTTNFLPTASVVTVNDYPYGFRLRTTLYDSIDFDAKKGYRHVTQTVNPKTGNLNKPKKSTYYPALFRYYNEVGHIKSRSLDFSGDEAINRSTQFLAQNFDLLTPDEVSYFYSILLRAAFIDMKATVTYCGADVEALKPLYTAFFDLCKQGLQDGSNLFASLVLDSEAINKTKIPDFNPFKVTTYVMAS